MTFVTATNAYIEKRAAWKLGKSTEAKDQALLRTSTVPTYLSGDWYRDWGTIERYDRIVPAETAPDVTVDQGAETVLGWTRRGPIRALPLETDK